ncbi:MAG: gamma-glutamyltranspeptidase/glutathione hydrolase [Candidatus Azotimanducaceae bacterium]|jgi:gamma-glutamyltranspeptidase/glutathione hydrolase
MFGIANVRSFERASLLVMARFLPLKIHRRSLEKNMVRKTLITLSLVMALAGCASQSDSAPDQVSPWSKGAIAATANPYATDAAISILEQGGHAVDAAIAAHLVLGLVEPQSSGIGGGGFLLAYDYDTKSLSFHDGREQAPSGATVDMFMKDGKVMGFFEAWQSGKAIGIPGAVAMYKQAHDAHGKLAWKKLFEPAIQLATRGFVVSPRMSGMLDRLKGRVQLSEHPAPSAYFYPNGESLKPGDVRDNPDYAALLTRIATEGIDAFYRGEVAQAMATAATSEPNPGTLSIEDIAAYRAVDRPVICGDFRDTQICTTSPPSSGGAQIMIAGLYDHLVAGSTLRDDKITALVDAQRLAYADRDFYFGDPDAVTIPLEDLLDPRYLKARAKDRFPPAATPVQGDPAAVLGRLASLDWGADTTQEPAGTTHLSIVDGKGNAVSLTATVEAPFGSSRWVHGFLLNNEMTDFAREVSENGKIPANAIAPGRRPRSSMSPTMVLDAGGNLLMVTGSPGGNSIPAYVAKTIIGVMAWDLSAQEAADHANIIARGKRVRVETGVGDGKAIAAMLNKRGYDVQEREGENSGIHLIVVRPDGLEGAADKRREGTVRTLP